MMSNSKGVVNRNTKTLGVTRPNKKMEQEKPQEPCSTISQKKKNRARSIKKKEKDDLMKKGKVDGGLMMTTRKLDQKKVVTLPPPAATTFIAHPPVEFVSSPLDDNSMRAGKKTVLRNRIPRPSKIPLSAVEMPPDYSSVNINFLDVSFGAFDLSDDIPQLDDPSQEQNSLPPVIKYDDSITQKLDSVLAQTEYSTISNQPSVQTQRSFQVNQASQPSIKILRRPNVPYSAGYLTKQNSVVATTLEQNALQPVVKNDDSITQKVDSVLAQTEYSKISNQASVQTQRSFQVNQEPQPSITTLRRPNVPYSADYFTKQDSAVANTFQNINTGQPTSMYNSSVSFNNPQGLSSHTSLYGTTASNIGGNSSISHNPQLSRPNNSNLNANNTQTETQPQFPSYPYPNPYSYQASGISYPPIVSDANLASMHSTSTNYNYMHPNIHQTGNTNLSESTNSEVTSTTNSTKESLYYQSQPSNNSWTSNASNPNGNIISDTTSSIGLKQSILLTSNTSTPTTNDSSVLSGMPSSVAPLVDAQYILNQQCIPGHYSQSPSVMNSKEHLQMVQSGLPHHSMTNFYSPNPMYPSVSSSLTGRETAGPGILNVTSYSPVIDSRYALTDNNASPDSSTVSQQTGTLAHQQILLNLPIDPSYTYYYGQMAVPANLFQYGTLYLMVPAASATSHGTVATNTMSGYSNTAATPAGFNNVNETLGSSSVTGSSNDHGSSSKVGVSGQQITQAQGMTNLSDLPAMYPSKSMLNKMVLPASATSHGTVATNTISGYSNTAATPAGYNNVNETLGSSSVTGSSNDHGSSSKVGVSGQQITQAQGITNLSDLPAIYPRKSMLNKPYDKQQQSFQSPPPFSVTNNDRVGGHHTAGSYHPVFNSSIPPDNQQHHHITPLQHQQEHRCEIENMSHNQSVNPTANKVKVVKQNYN